MSSLYKIKVQLTKRKFHRISATEYGFLIISVIL